MSSSDRSSTDEGDYYNNIASDHQHKYQPRLANLVVFDGHTLKFAKGRGVDEETPLLLGNRDLSCAENGSRLVLDPKTGSLFAGDSAWQNQPQHSFFVGTHNEAELKQSMLVGDNHKTTFTEAENVTADMYKRNTVLGGENNELNNCLDCAVVGSSNVHLENCSNTVVLGLNMETNPDEPVMAIAGLKDTMVVPTAMMQKLHVGPVRESESQIEADAIVNGDMYVDGSVKITKQVDAATGTFDSVVAESGTFQNLTVANFTLHSTYVAGESTFTLTKGDGVSVVYANTVGGDVKVQLGTEENSGFESSRCVMIKDVSLQFAPGSAHNIYVSVPTGVKIEHYGALNGQTGSYGLMVSEAGSYIVNSSGGNVKLCYMEPLVPGGMPTWAVVSEFRGNPRVIGSSGIRFPSASSQVTSKMFK